MMRNPGEILRGDSARAVCPSSGPGAARRSTDPILHVTCLTALILTLAFGAPMRAQAGMGPLAVVPSRPAASRAVKQPAPAGTTVMKADTAATSARADTTARPRRLIAYYFRTTNRCPSCRKIEAWSREAIETAFPRELKSGLLVWRMVNVEEKGNEHFVKDYQLFTKSVVLVDEVRGRQARWKNLARVWELLPDKEGFVRYVQAETRDYLATGP